MKEQRTFEVMVRNDELGIENIYNALYINPIYDAQTKTVYGEIHLENGETATFNMDEWDFYDLRPLKIEKFKTDFIYN